MDKRCKDCVFFDRDEEGSEGICRALPPGASNGLFASVDGELDWCGNLTIATPKPAGGIVQAPPGMQIKKNGGK